VCLFVSVIGNFEHRISAHRLHIETGRYQGIPPHQRLCEQCDSGEVEDEIVNKIEAVLFSYLNYLQYL
jgi:hypothetical protein